MDMLKDMNEALRYIEEHLDRDIDFGKVAKIAGVSEFHFRKLFSYLSGMGLSSYIRSRRLSQAAIDLQRGQERILDVAIKYGYDSADGFSRAFREWSGMNPSEVKNSEHFKAFPRLTFQLTIRGGMDMNTALQKKTPLNWWALKNGCPSFLKDRILKL